MTGPYRPILYIDWKNGNHVFTDSSLELVTMGFNGTLENPFKTLYNHLTLLKVYLKKSKTSCFIVHES